MAEKYVWVCGCGETGTGEAAAQRHVRAGCTLFGMPRGRCLAAREARTMTTPKEET